MTGNVIRSTMLYLAASPLIYLRLQSEIDTAISSGRASTPIAYNEAKALTYLQAVIYEGIRIHPPNFSLTSKRVPSEGDTLHGQFVPGGTEIAQNSWSLLRNEGIFGKDVDVFRPERFLEVDKEKRVEMERVTELLFGYGRWMCPGKFIAFLEISKVVFEVSTTKSLFVWAGCCCEIFDEHVEMELTDVEFDSCFASSTFRSLTQRLRGRRGSTACF